MKIEGIEFPEALKILGDRSGVHITANSSSIRKDDYFQINEIAKNLNVIVVKHERNMGYGAAINTIFQRAKDIGTEKASYSISLPS